jgi:hypothetical protein
MRHHRRAWLLSFETSYEFIVGPAIYAVSDPFLDIRAFRRHNSGLASHRGIALLHVHY